MREDIRKSVSIIVTGTLIFSLVGIILILVYKTFPTKKEIEQQQQEQVRAIKLCLSNDLDAYQGLAGVWFCKPKVK